MRLAGRVALVVFSSLAVAVSAEESSRVIHVFVALCDNKHQGIVPVPDALGNGQDPDNNLYWGAMYGVRTFFRRSEHWREILNTSENLSKGVLRRSVFELREASPPLFVVADAYDGRSMKECLSDFLRALGGASKLDVSVKDRSLAAGSASQLICYVGHNGFMDGDVSDPVINEKGSMPQYIALACKSDMYFRSKINSMGNKPVLTTASFMAPEAYVLDAALREWGTTGSAERICAAATRAYAKYQKISEKAARKVFVVGKD